MKRPMDADTALDLIHSERTTMAAAVPLENYRSVVNYAKWLESELDSQLETAANHEELLGRVRDALLGIDQGRGIPQIRTGCCPLCGREEDD